MLLSPPPISWPPTVVCNGYDPDIEIRAFIIDERVREFVERDTPVLS
jgi:hypothetical protein